MRDVTKTRLAQQKPDNKERMLHIRLDPDLHRRLRIIVASEDMTLQKWITRLLIREIERLEKKG